MSIHIDGDFKSNKGNCSYHCLPTCHPGQILKDKLAYGCTNKAWPSNRYGDFCPLVNCDGDIKKCEIPLKFLYAMRRGATLRIKNAEKKLLKAKMKRTEYDYLIYNIKQRGTTE